MAQKTVVTDKAAKNSIPSCIRDYLVDILTVQLHNLGEDREKSAEEKKAQKFLKRGKLGGQNQSILLSDIFNIFQV
jgi:hypothetical protein